MVVTGAHVRCAGVGVSVGKHHPLSVHKPHATSVRGIAVLSDAAEALRLPRKIKL